MAIASSERPRPLRSRIHRARHILGELRRLRVKLELAHGIAGTDDEKRWCLSTADKLDSAIVAGDAVLGGFSDPRPGRIARKRPGLFD